MSNIVEGAKKTRILFVPAELIEAVNKLSRRTRLRCQRALELWRTGNYDYIAVTGGKFLKPSIQTVPAGQLMSEWLYEHGVDPERLIVEIYSLDTYENITGSITVMTEGWSLRRLDQLEITVVSEVQHSWRIRQTFWNIYQLQVKIEPVSYPMSVKERLMECIYFLIHFFDTHGTLPFLVKRREKLQREAEGL